MINIGLIFKKNTAINEIANTTYINAFLDIFLKTDKKETKRSAGTTAFTPVKNPCTILLSLNLL